MVQDIVDGQRPNDADEGQAAFQAACADNAPTGTRPEGGEPSCIADPATGVAGATRTPVPGAREPPAPGQQRETEDLEKQQIDEQLHPLQDPAQQQLQQRSRIDTENLDKRQDEPSDQGSNKG